MSANFQYSSKLQVRAYFQRDFVSWLRGLFAVLRSNQQTLDSAACLINLLLRNAVVSEMGEETGSKLWACAKNTSRSVLLLTHLNVISIKQIIFSVLFISHSFIFNRAHITRQPTSHAWIISETWSNILMTEQLGLTKASSAADMHSVAHCLSRF